MHELKTETFAVWAVAERECRLSFVPTGTQVRILARGRLLYSRIFNSEREAVAWAAEEKATFAHPAEDLIEDLEQALS